MPGGTLNVVKNGRKFQFFATDGLMQFGAKAE